MASENRTYTYRTQTSGTVLLHSAPPNQWQVVKLFLESNAPCAVGEDANLEPVGDGPGRLLPFNQEVVVTLPPGGRLYISATSVCRVAVQVEYNPWLEQMTNVLRSILTTLQGPTARSQPQAGQVVDIGDFGFTGGK